MKKIAPLEIFKEYIKKDEEARTKIMIVISSILLIAFLFYDYLNSPHGTIRAALNAIQNHDTEKFSQYIDIDSVLSNAYNALPTDTTKLKKEEFVAALKGEILHFVKNGEWNTNSDPFINDFQKNIEIILEHTNHKSAFSFIYPADRIDNKADYPTLEFDIYDKRTDRKITMRAKMKKINEVWAVEELENLKDFFEGKATYHPRLGMYGWNL